MLKKERPVTMLYLMHSYTTTVSRTVEMVMSQNRRAPPSEAILGISIVSPPPTEMPKLIACGPKAASKPANVKGYGFGTLNSPALPGAWVVPVCCATSLSITHLSV